MRHAITFIAVLACSVAFSQKKMEVDTTTINISDFRQITWNDNYCHFSLPLPTPGMEVNPSAFMLDLGVDALFGSMRLGELRAGFAKSVFLTDLMDNPGFYPVKDVSTNEFNVSAIIPFRKREPVKYRSLPLRTKMPGKYYTMINQKIMVKDNITVGFFQEYVRTASASYSKHLNETLPYFWPLSHDGASNWSGWLDQSIQTVRIGYVHSTSVNTKLKGVNQIDTEFSGRLFSVFSLYSNLVLAVNSTSSPVHYKYSTNGDPNQGTPTIIEEDVDLTAYTHYYKVGMNVGLDFFSMHRDKGISTHVKLELGSRPGHQDNFLKTLYLNVSLYRIGLGFCSQKGKNLVMGAPDLHEALPPKGW